MNTNIAYTEITVSDGVIPLKFGTFAQRKQAERLNLTLSGLYELIGRIAAYSFLVSEISKLKSDESVNKDEIDSYESQLSQLTVTEEDFLDFIYSVVWAGAYNAKVLKNEKFDYNEAQIYNWIDELGFVNISNLVLIKYFEGLPKANKEQSENDTKKKEN